MQLVGAAAPCAGPILDDIAHAVEAGRAVVLWCDGEDLMAVIGGQGDAAAEVARYAPRLIPGLPS